MALFSLGKTVMTPGIAELLEKHRPNGHQALFKLLSRHASGDWGNLSDDDKRANDRAIQVDARILSAYNLLGEKVWLITEADRSATTVLFPEEY